MFSKKRGIDRVPEPIEHGVACFDGEVSQTERHPLKRPLPPTFWSFGEHLDASRSRPPFMFGLWCSLTEKTPGYLTGP